MTNLISGADALRALADGKTVEVKRIHDNEWQPAQVFGVSVFTDFETTSFRLKPRTITINGIEVPAPFEPKEGDEVYFIDCEPRQGYLNDLIGDGCEPEWTQFGAWRTEDEVKQVVEALRHVFGKEMKDD